MKKRVIAIMLSVMIIISNVSYYTEKVYGMGAVIPYIGITVKEAIVYLMATSGVVVTIDFVEENTDIFDPLANELAKVEDAVNDAYYDMTGAIEEDIENVYEKVAYVVEEGKDLAMEVSDKVWNKATETIDLLVNGYYSSDITVDSTATKIGENLYIGYSSEVIELIDSVGLGSAYNEIMTSIAESGDIVLALACTESGEFSVYYDTTEKVSMYEIAYNNNTGKWRLVNTNTGLVNKYSGYFNSSKQVRTSQFEGQSTSMYSTDAVYYCCIADGLEYAVDCPVTLPEELAPDVIFLDKLGGLIDTLGKDVINSIDVVSPDSTIGADGYVYPGVRNPTIPWDLINDLINGVWDKNKVDEQIKDKVVAKDEDGAEAKVDTKAVAYDETTEKVVSIVSTISGSEASLSGLKSYATQLSGFFPFCIPYDLVNLIKAFRAVPRTPKFSFPIVFEKWGIDTTFKIDLSDFDYLASVCRTFEKIMFIIMLMHLTKKIVKW